MGGQKTTEKDMKFIVYYNIFTIFASYKVFPRSGNQKANVTQVNNWKKHIYHANFLEWLTSISWSKLSGNKERSCLYLISTITY